MPKTTCALQDIEDILCERYGIDGWFWEETPDIQTTIALLNDPEDTYPKIGTLRMSESTGYSFEFVPTELIP